MSDEYWSFYPTKTSKLWSFPQLRLQREQGLLPSRNIAKKLLRVNEHGDETAQPVWNLSTTTQIIAGGSTRSYTTALDLEKSSGNNRFVCAGSNDGTISIFDLWRNPMRAAATTVAEVNASERAVQQTTVGGRVSSIQWYPVDTGIFLAATTSGSFSLFDTAAMVPVLTVKPFETITSFDVSPFSMTAAVGSSGSTITKLMDLRSGAAAHSLIFPNKLQSLGVSSVHWSPVHGNVLLTCSGCAALWDTRKAKHPIAALDEANRVQDETISTSFYADGSHFWRTKKGTKRKVSNGDCNSSKSVSYASTATVARFDPTGQLIVTVCGKQQTISLYDVRYAVPLKTPYRFVNAFNGRPVNRGACQPLLFSNNAIWVSQGNSMYRYNIQDRSGKPVSQLRGHLHRIQAITETANLTQDRILTASTDGLILVWDRQRLSTRSANQKRKLEDVDNW